MRKWKRSAAGTDARFLGRLFSRCETLVFRRTIFRRGIGGQRMDTEKYRALVSAIDCGTLSRTAEQMGYTVSAVSRMIASLEEEHGFPLLVRSKTGVVPTPECSQLLPLMRRLLVDADELYQTGMQISGCLCGTVRVATAYSIYYDRISRVIREFHEKYPGVQVEIAEGGYSSELADKLLQHQIDIAVISERETDLSFTLLCEDELVVLLPDGHPCAGLERVPISLLKKGPYIETYPGRDVDNIRMLQKNGIRPESMFRSNDVYATVSMVRAGMGVALLNGIGCEFVDQSVCVRKLEPPQKVRIGIASRHKSAPATKLFLQALVKQIPD